MELFPPLSSSRVAEHQNSDVVMLPAPVSQDRLRKPLRASQHGPIIPGQIQPAPDSIGKQNQALARCQPGSGLGKAQGSGHPVGGPAGPSAVGLLGDVNGDPVLHVTPSPAPSSLR